MSKRDRIHKSLNRLKKRGYAIDLDIECDSWVIFSDHHRGVGDGADDFAPCKQTYLNALSHYQKSNTGLVLLGDVEEFWENTLKSVISKYPDVLEAEKQFHDSNKLIKVWGNHDDAWNHLNEVSTYLFPFFYKIATHESINIRVMADKKSIGDILLVHGHQGSGASDKFSGISRWFVRVIWRNLQRLFKIPLSTPSKSKELKDQHDIAMHSWAKNIKRQIVISGHTHQPVFMSRNHLDILTKELDLLKCAQYPNMDSIALVERKISTLNQKTSPIGTLVSDQQPCYFNTGCCSFGDGDITGVEIDKGAIRLIKWDENSGRKVISSEQLTEIFKLL